MSSPEIIAGNENGNIRIRVSGRATFGVAGGFQDLVKNLDPETLQSIVIDLKGCETMDSTFMGIMTKLALMALKRNIRPEIVNADRTCIGLLSGLGVKKLFVFVEPAADASPVQGVNLAERKTSAYANAEMVVDAHQTLINADDSNRARFADVVELAKTELADTPPNS